MKPQSVWPGKQGHLPHGPEPLASAWWPGQSQSARSPFSQVTCLQYWRSTEQTRRLCPAATWKHVLKEGMLVSLRPPGTPGGGNRGQHLQERIQAGPNHIHCIAFVIAETKAATEMKGGFGSQFESAVPCGRAGTASGA